MEKRVTSKTGGQKGQKPQQLSQLPLKSLLKIAEVGTFGAEKYSKYNYRKGYEFSLGFDAAVRHMFEWQEGEDNDPVDAGGSGLSHLAHAAWHLVNLLYFMDEHPEFDDRPYTVMTQTLKETLEEDIENVLKENCSTLCD